MIRITPSKINLGLNVVGRRADGYHDLETVFYPVNICDSLEITDMDHRFPLASDIDIHVYNTQRLCADEDNIIVKAYRLLSQHFTLPRIHAHLFKEIPSQAGMGGGSSDGTDMLLLLNERCHLGLSNDQLIDYARQLGADCPFFVLQRAAYAEGIGERLTPLNLNLSDYYLLVVKPEVSVSTREAFALITPQRPPICCREVVTGMPISQWRHHLTNDFETSVFAQYPQLNEIKSQLYAGGAIYAAMTGSGSSLFGIFSTHAEAESAYSCSPLLSSCAHWVVKML